MQPAVHYITLKLYSSVHYNNPIFPIINKDTATPPQTSKYKHCSGFLTLPTAYVTGNPVECVLHPRLWNQTTLWDPLGIGNAQLGLRGSDGRGQSFDDEYEEENVGYPINQVPPPLVFVTCH